MSVRSVLDFGTIYPSRPIWNGLTAHGEVSNSKI